MGYSRRFSGFVLVALATLISVTTVHNAAADVFTSTSYQIDASVSGSFGGQTSSTSYKMVSSGGESVIGNGASGSYKMGQGYIAQLDKSLQLTVQPQGLLGYWPMDEATGAVAWDGSLSNAAAPFTGSPTWQTGKIGGGLGGFSASNYLDTNNSAAFNVSAVTVCSWANMTSTSSNPWYVSRSVGAPSTDGMWALGFNSGSTARAYVIANGGTQYDAISTLGAVGTGVWSHNCFTYGGTDLKLYVNGQLAATTPINQALGSHSQPLKIGARGNGANPFPGLVDEVKVFSRVLTTDEIKAEYDAQNAGIASGLSLNTLTPGASQTAAFDTVIQTDAPGYDLSIQQDHNLQFGANTIPAISGSIASPLTWTEGSTKGLGFTLYSTNATAIPGKWGGGAAYAALPASGTGFYSRTGYNGGTKDVLNLRLRADVMASQPSGFYSNMVTITGTMTP